MLYRMKWNSRRAARVLRAYLDEHRMTQSQLAERLGESQALISRVLNGTARPPASRCDRWAEVVGIDPATFYPWLTRVTPFVKAPSLNTEDRPQEVHRAVG